MPEMSCCICGKTAHQGVGDSSLCNSCYATTGLFSAWAAMRAAKQAIGFMTATTIWGIGIMWYCGPASGEFLIAVLPLIGVLLYKWRFYVRRRDDYFLAMCRGPEPSLFKRLQRQSR